MARTCTNFLLSGKYELVYVIPRPGSPTTILGGRKQIGNWDASVHEKLSKRIRILRRARE